MNITKEKNRRFPVAWHLFVFLLLTLSLFGCPKPTPPKTTQLVLKSVSLTPNGLYLALNKPRPFKLTGTLTDDSTTILTASATWSSSAPSIATVSPLGVVNTLTVGQTVITAKHNDSFSSSTTLTVATVAVEAITVTAEKPDTVVGGKNQFTAIGTWSDGKISDITQSAIWRVSNSAATIGTTGLATGVSAGSPTVTAQFHGIEGTISTTVKAVSLNSIIITPLRALLLPGLTQQFTATGVFSDKISRNLSAEEVVWSSSDPTIATITNKGKARGSLPSGKVTIAATAISSLGSKTGSAILSVLPGKLDSINLIPKNHSIAKETKMKYTAIGTFDTGASEDITELADWSTSSAGIATIDSTGLVTAANVTATATTTITASFGPIGTSTTVVSASTSLTVRNVTLSAILVTPVSAFVPIGITEQFFATGIFSDGITQDLAYSVQWSADSTVATIDATGRALGKRIGTVNIRATADFGDKTSGSTVLTVSNATLSSIQIEPQNWIMAVESVLQFKAIGTFSNGTTKDLTESAVWSVSEGDDIASISKGGLVYGLKSGTAEIRAAFESASVQTRLDVRTLTLDRIEITTTDKTPTIPVGISRQYVAKGIYGDLVQDISASVSWNSSEPARATVNQSGLATGKNEGETYIRATLDTTRGPVTGTTTLKVNNAKLQTVTVSPQSKSVGQGAKVQYKAEANYSEEIVNPVNTVNTVFDVTAYAIWSVTDGTIAIINQGGLLTTIKQGTTTVSATFQSTSAITGLTVTAAVIDHILITPSNPKVPQGDTQSFTAIGVFTDNDEQDLTTAVSWESDKIFVATISNDAGSQGLATTFSTSGTSEIRAWYGTSTGTTTLTVAAAVPKDLALGKKHSCTLMTNGEMKCWGQNTFGQLGNGSIKNISTPEDVNSIGQAINMTAGGAHTCATFKNGTVRCWGNNAYGQIGDGTNNRSLLPIPVKDLLGTVSVTAGESHTCARLQSGVIKCWGDNQFGQLGNGSTSASSTIPVSTHNSVWPSDAIDAGDFHTCALRPNGNVFCWGDNRFGQLGNNSTATSTTPVMVPSFAAKSISAGGGHTCAIRSLDNSVACWGNNSSGQLGNNTTATSTAPVFPGGLPAIAVSAGGAHTCALLTNDTVSCWGDNRSGQLGLGNSTSTIIRSLVPVSVDLGVDKAKSILTGGLHTCVQLIGGNMKCWGDNNSGQIGNGQRAISSTPILVPEISSATSVTAGGNFTCFNTSGGTSTIKCMGSNEDGQLGNATMENSPVPSDVFGITGAESVSAGHSHACARNASSIQCWGDNNNGQLGNETRTASIIPVVVQGNLNAIAVLAGTSYNCALENGPNNVKCWGYGNNGQMGNGTRNDNALPGLVANTMTASTLAVGDSHACVILSGGTVYCWGENSYGQAGTSAETNWVLTPSPVTIPSGAIAIAAGEDHTCAISNTREVYCWGNNNMGQLGVNPFDLESPDTTTTSSLPLHVVGIFASAITAGDRYTCAIINVNNHVYCWGFNDVGQLGIGRDDLFESTPALVPQSRENTPTPLTVSSIDAGVDHVCAMLQNPVGQVKCWGNNSTGQIGTGLVLIAPLPVDVKF
ncbi:MAG: Ig-like domain-containing protein [Nitrospirota bacterium]